MKVYFEACNKIFFFLHTWKFILKLVIQNTKNKPFYILHGLNEIIMSDHIICFIYLVSPMALAGFFWREVAISSCLLAWVSFTSVLLFKALLKIVITVLLQKVGFTVHFSVNTGLLFPLQSSQSSASRGESVCAVAPHPDHHGGGGVCWPAQWEDKGLFHTGAVSTQGCHTAHEDQWKEPNQAALRRAIWPYWRQPDRAVSPGFWWMSRLPMLINLTVPINLAYS